MDLSRSQSRHAAVAAICGFLVRPAGPDVRYPGQPRRSREMNRTLRLLHGPGLSTVETNPAQIVAGLGDGPRKFRGPVQSRTRLIVRRRPPPP